MTESYYPCYNWYISLVKRLMFTQFMHGTWVDDLSETSQKEKLGNVCIYYVDFLPSKCFPPLRDSETFVAFSYGQVQLLNAHL